MLAIVAIAEQLNWVRVEVSMRRNVFQPHDITVVHRTTVHRRIRVAVTRLEHPEVVVVTAFVAGHLLLARASGVLGTVRVQPEN